MASILWLAQVASAGAEHVGGKAASLGRLHLAGFAVPGAFAIPIEMAERLAGANSESASAYRAHAAIGGEARMAVLVQRMVRAEIAGVAFSIDPVTGDAGRVVVEAVAGTGESLASGHAEADRVVLLRADLAVIEEHHPATPVLTIELAAEVAGAAIRAEETFGQPQDIEFAVEAGKLWMLQSRPVTTAVNAVIRRLSERIRHTYQRR